MRIDFLIERRTYHRFLLHLMKFFFAIRFELLLSSVILIELYWCCFFLVILPRLAFVALNNNHQQDEKKRTEVALQLFEAYSALSCCCILPKTFVYHEILYFQLYCQMLMSTILTKSSGSLVHPWPLILNITLYCLTSDLEGWVVFN